MNRIVSAILGSLLAAGCATQAAPQKTSLRPDANAGTGHVRLCDERVDYALRPADATAPDRPFYGVWKGDVMFGGYSGTMCVGLVVQEIRQGKANNMWVWNLGEGRDMTNMQGMGKVNWWGRMQDGRMILDDDKPYRGNFYAFEFDPPNARGELRGKYKVVDAAGGASAVYPVVMYRYPVPVPAAPTAVASN